MTFFFCHKYVMNYYPTLYIQAIAIIIIFSISSRMRRKELETKEL